MAGNDSNRLLITNLSLESISVTIQVGEVKEESGSVVVHWVGPDFNISTEGLTKNILEKCGMEIVRELNFEQGSKLGVTDGGNSLCQHIFFVVTPHSEDELADRMRDISVQADARGMSYISVPVTSVGMGDVLSCGIAESMLKALAAWSKRTDVQYSRKQVFIHTNNKKEYLVFREVFLRQHGMVLLDDEMDFETSVPSGQQDRPHIKEDEKLDISEYIMKNKLIIRALSGAEVREIADVAETSCVTICVSKEIKILGWKENVVSAVEKINAIFDRHRRNSRAKHLQQIWQWKTEKNAWTEFSGCASGEIEAGFKRYQRSETAASTLLFVDKELGVCRVDFSQSTIISAADKRLIGRHPAYTTESTMDIAEMKNTFEKINLFHRHEEYAAIENMVKASLQPCRIHSIKKIHNKDLRLLFERQKEIVKGLTCADAVVERQLFHGTSANSAQLIMKNGFDKSRIGLHGAAYGRGIYFTPHAGLSDRYALPNPEGRRTVLLTSVITGRCKCVEPRQILRAARRGVTVMDEDQPYESFVNKEADPSIFVIFNELSAYPSYEITYCHN